MNRYLKESAATPRAAFTNCQLILATLARMETLDFLLARPVAMFVVLAIGAMIGIAVEKGWTATERKRRQAYWAGRNKVRHLRPAASPPRQSDHDTGFAAEQLQSVMNARFTARHLLNKSERRLLGVIDAALQEHSDGWRAMGQVSLGEILASKDKDAYLAINSKRVDLLIVDAETRPVHVIEFQGTGHHLSDNTAARDATKKEALRRAGIGYVEVVTGDTPAEVREMIRKLAHRETANAGGEAR